MGNQIKREKTVYGKTYELTDIKKSTTKKSKPTQHDTIYEDENSVIIIDAKMYGYQENLLSDKVLGKQFGYYEQAKMVKQQKGEKKNIINILMLPNYVEADRPYFQNTVITDPHTPASADPYKIIYIYQYPARELIDDYYYGRKKSDFLINEFKKFIEDQAVKHFLQDRGCKYNF